MDRGRARARAREKEKESTEAVELDVAQGGCNGGRWIRDSLQVKVHRNRYHKGHGRFKAKIFRVLCSLWPSAVPESQKCWWWLDVNSLDKTGLNKGLHKDLVMKGKRDDSLSHCFD